MEGTIFSLVPPVIAIVMAVITRRVLLSLGSGVVAGLLLVKDFSVIEGVKYVYDLAYAILTDTWYLYILLFLLLLGIISALITISGGARAFGDWAMERVKTRRGAKLLTIFLGLIIFIDDYFNSLTVGNVVRPLTDKHKISRAKLAYFVDSTAAPICIVTPISSWGAVIIGTIGGVLTTQGLTDIKAFSAFIEMIPMNFYFIYAILFVFAVAIFNLNIGPMKKHEEKALNEGIMFDASKADAPRPQEEVNQNGRVFHLLLPFGSLIVTTLLAMIWTGINAIEEGPITALNVAENIDVTGSLLFGGLVSTILTVILLLVTDNKVDKVGKGLYTGILSMLPTSIILIFAWILVTIISDLSTGEYLSGLVSKTSLNIAYLPVIVFLLAGVMAFSTGTSWGTFAIMLPIAGEIAGATNIELILPMLAAVLAGSVFGDHASPISDTTILSSTGAGSPLIDHVVTQLPYALMVAAISMVGYIVLGFTASVMLALAISFAVFIFTVLILRKLS
ncbi:sodium:proton antiporter [Lottiidibacillus patelloidae]|uniref:Sodium:proton antiporter n=1 Tax=Lottiidibacillus patelloidae TaxID=2670334 RepID=A0A263BQW2_9BACI|nr:Na+/H+ antiporter NhaC family protein [Lottiidibacillus patelloidae]OZM55972.1 sodium:proton antiporter [Lottiidibacillus patelloidae]